VVAQEGCFCVRTRIQMVTSYSGNGVREVYSLDPATRRLDNVRTVDESGDELSVL
jgi:hypothetical protein